MPMGTTVERTGTKAPWICRECNSLYHYRGDAPRRRVQLCLCDRSRNEPLWSGKDYNEDERLCACCCVVPVASGSRWSRLHCDDCLRRVRALNETEGRIVVGVGRHTAMNVVSQPRPVAAAPEDPREALRESLRAAIKGLLRAHDERKAWLAARMEALRAAAGVPVGHDVSLHTLRARLEASAPELLTSADAFRAMAGDAGVAEEVVASVEAGAVAHEQAAERARLEAVVAEARSYALSQQPPDPWPTWAATAEALNEAWRRPAGHGLADRLQAATPTGRGRSWRPGTYWRMDDPRVELLIRLGRGVIQDELWDAIRYEHLADWRPHLLAQPLEPGLLRLLDATAGEDGYRCELFEIDDHDDLFLEDPPLIAPIALCWVHWHRSPNMGEWSEDWTGSMDLHAWPEDDRIRYRGVGHWDEPGDLVFETSSERPLSHHELAVLVREGPYEEGVYGASVDGYGAPREGW